MPTPKSSFVGQPTIGLFAELGWAEAVGNGNRVSNRQLWMREEIADVAILLFEMADLLGMRLGEVMEAKIARNEERYSADKSRGKNLNYNEL